jgi:nicotianamine synthase
MPADATVTDVRGEIHRIYQSLATAPSLAPSERVNGLFTDLVRLARAGAPATVRQVLEDPIVRAIQGNLQRLCSRGEYLLEAHWARILCEAPADAWVVLRSFPYFDNYLQLSRLEMTAVATVAAPPIRHGLFVGGGPLPLTALLLAREHGLSVTSVEVDAQACQLSRGLARRLGLTEALEIRQADILEVDDYQDFDLVVLASLVGVERRAKDRVLAHLGRHMKPGTLLVLRSAARLRSLLYPRVELDQLAPFEPLLEIHPHHEVINSVIIARRQA